MSGVTLLAAARGSVGGRLLLLWQRQTVRVRCVTRRPEALEDCRSPSSELTAGDLLDRASFSAAFDGVDTAYYLVHSMGTTEILENRTALLQPNLSRLLRSL